MLLFGNITLEEYTRFNLFSLYTITSFRGIMLVYTPTIGKFVYPPRVQIYFVAVNQQQTAYQR